MRSVWKAGGLVLLVMALVWLVSMWRWQTGGRDVGGTELLVQLVVLPLVLAAALLVALKVTKSVRQAPAVAVPLDAAGSPSEAGNLASNSSAAERTCSALVAAVAIELPLPGEAAQVLRGLQEGAQRPVPDADLTDLDGMPVFCARVADLDADEALPEALLTAAPEQVKRSWVMLGRVLDKQLLALSELLDGLAQTTQPAQTSMTGESTPSMKAHLSGMTHETPVAPRDVPPRSQVAVVCAVSADWAASWQDALHAWLKMRCGDLQADGRAMDLQVHMLPVESAHEVWPVLDATLLRWHREPHVPRCATLLIAADSAIDPDVVDRWQSRGELFTAAHQSGRMPGEGAVGVLLVHAHWPDTGTLPPLARLYRPVQQTRDKSADAQGRIGHAEIRAAMAQAVQLSGRPAEALTMVVSDGDHRASRTCEVFEALLAFAPACDPMQSVLRVGDGCGDLGLTSAWLPLALAAGSLAQNPAEDSVALAVQVQPSHHRTAIALVPWVVTSTPAVVPT